VQFPNYGTRFGGFDTADEHRLLNHLCFLTFNSEVHSVSALLPCFQNSGLKRPLAQLSGNRFETYSSWSAFLVMLLGGIV